MATAVMTPRKTKVQSDRIFFPLMCLLILVTVWLGFSKTYYAAGMVTAHLPAPIIHVHAAAMTLWLLTLTVQTSLVSVRRVKLHMVTGLWGFALAASMIPIGTLAAINALRRDMSPPGSGLTPLTFFVVPVTALLAFALLAGWSYAVRRKPDQHKRLILLATVPLLDAAVGRFPETLGIASTPMSQLLILCMFPAALIAYDLISRRRIQRVTWMGTLVLLVIWLTRIPLAQTAPWQALAKLVHG
ncbi:MAG TPA: hypothetical protein VGL22_03465 [Terracidiphilus sp.]